jgi:hypothetical protein
MIVTTSYDPSRDIVSLAERLAEQLKARIVRRDRMTVRALQEAHSVRDVVVVTEKGLKCYRNGNEPLFFHPGTSMFRIKRMLSGTHREPMLEISEAGPGDTVIDCTAGLCSDAIVFSHAVGSEGRVIAVEADPLISLVASHGLQSLETDVPEMNAAMRRIEMRHGHHLDVLRSLPDKSADIVYFDPMFRTPVEKSNGIAPLRAYAHNQTVSIDAVEEARRVARKTVVLKEIRGSGLFGELGFTVDGRKNSKIAFGVIRIQ